MNFHIDSLFSPHSWAEFISDYFEQKHLLIRRGNPRYYDELLTLADIDEVIFSQKLNHPAFRVVDSKTGEFPDPRGYTQHGTSTIDPVEFTKAFTKGGTLALAGMQHHLRALRSFCNDLQNRTGHPFQTNLYLTPPDAQGFSPHYDNHDVIVLQIHGKKSWRLYESEMNIPDKSMPFEKEGFVPGKVFQEFDMVAGDLLYIPRGLVHDAITTDESSLHITVGMLGYTWSQHLIESIVHLTSKHQDLRKFASSRLVTDDHVEMIESFSQLLKEEMLTGAGMLRFEEQLAAQTPSSEQGRLLHLIGGNEVDANTEVRAVQQGYAVEDAGDKVKLCFGSKELLFPSYCKQECVSFVAFGGSFKALDLDGDLDDEGKLVFVKRLLLEGWAERVN